MPLFRLIYTSKSAPTLHPNDLDAILRSSKKNNYRKDITGLLCYLNNTFIQCLEGKEQAVKSTYEKICNDPRHSNITIHYSAPTTERLFSTWSMGLTEEGQVAQQLGITRLPGNFTSMNANEAVEFFQQLADLKESLLVR